MHLEGLGGLLEVDHGLQEGIQVQFVQQALRGEVLLTSASVKVGCVDIATMRPRSLPKQAAVKMRAA